MSRRLPRYIYVFSITQIIYSTNVRFLFSCFRCSLVSVSKKRGIEIILILIYFKFNKINEKRSQGYQSMGAEYIFEQIKSSYSATSFETILPFDFSILSKILICCSLMKRFPNFHKICSSHLKVSILHRVAPVKVYLRIYENLKNGYLKNIRTMNKERF